jgi:hypothetical protein
MTTPDASVKRLFRPGISGGVICVGGRKDAESESLMVMCRHSEDPDAQSIAAI